MRACLGACTCVYVCMHVCMCVCMYVGMYRCMYACIQHARAHVCVFVVCAFSCSLLFFVVYAHMFTPLASLGDSYIDSRWFTYSPSSVCLSGGERINHWSCASSVCLVVNAYMSCLAVGRWTLEPPSRPFFLSLGTRSRIYLFPIELSRLAT